MAICWERAVPLAFHLCYFYFWCRLGCRCPFPVWCLGQGVELDCVGSWSLPFYLLFPKKGSLQLCQNYSTISLIRHPSKVMWKVIHNRLQPQAEEIISEEQAGFKAERSTTEQIFNPLREVPAASAESLLCRYRLQEGL